MLSGYWEYVFGIKIHNGLPEEVKFKVSVWT